MSAELPKYPVSIGKRMSTRVEARRDRYRAAADRLREELADAEAAWARAFEQEDISTAAQNRIDLLARRAKRIL